MTASWAEMSCNLSTAKSISPYIVDEDSPIAYLIMIITTYYYYYYYYYIQLLVNKIHYTEWTKI